MFQQKPALCPAGRRTRHLVAFLSDDGAQDLLEYAFLAAFFGIAGWVALMAIGPTVNSVYSSWLSPTTGVPSLWDPDQSLLSSGS
jgi:hypothetical protein